MSFIREHVVKRLTRSKGWRKVRNTHIAGSPTCAVCGRKKGAEVHHIKDFSTHPELELDLMNLVTLCRKRCHMLFGHLLNWKSINPHAAGDTYEWQHKIENRR